MCHDRLLYILFLRGRAAQSRRGGSLGAREFVNSKRLRRALATLKASCVQYLGSAPSVYYLLLPFLWRFAKFLFSFSAIVVTAEQAGKRELTSIAIEGAGNEPKMLQLEAPRLQNCCRLRDLRPKELRVTNLRTRFNLVTITMREGRACVVLRVSCHFYSSLFSFHR